MRGLSTAIFYTSTAMYVLFGLAVLGIERKNTLEAALKVEEFYKLMVGAALVVFANPYQASTLPISLLKRLAFAAGIFILASSGITSVLASRLVERTGILPKTASSPPAGPVAP
jgi:hypothetical protein